MEDSSRSIFLPAAPDPVTFFDAVQSLFERDIYSWLSPAGGMEGVIIPRVFQFKNSEVVSESDCNIRKDRVGEYSEYVFYRALNLLIDRLHGEELGKMLVLRQLRLDLGRRKRMTLVYPTLNWMNLKDFDTDFLIIGQGVGVIGVEVKGTQSSLKDINHAKDQLDNIKYLLDFLVDSKILKPTCTIPFRRIIFAPNFLHAHLIPRSQDNIAYFFKEDLEFILPGLDLYGGPDGVQQKVIESATVPIANWLEKIIREYPASKLDADNTCDIAKAFIGIDSLVLVPPTYGISHKRSKSYALAGNKTLTEQEALECISSKIEQQNIGSQQKLHAATELKYVSDNDCVRSDSKLWKMVMLSTDQLTVLKGPNVQLIFGVAGTGKTLMIASKALELAQDPGNKRDIYIFASESFVPRYMEFFEQNNVVVNVLSHSFIYELAERIDRDEMMDYLLTKLKHFLNSSEATEETKAEEFLAYTDNTLPIVRTTLRFFKQISNIIAERFLSKLSCSLAEGHIFIDDAVTSMELQRDEMGAPSMEEILLGSWPLLLLLLKPAKDQYLWYVADLWQVLSFLSLAGVNDIVENAADTDTTETIIEQFLENCLYGGEQQIFVELLFLHVISNQIPVCLLHQVMRCPNEVFSVMEQFLDSYMDAWQRWSHGGLHILKQLFSFLAAGKPLSAIGHRETGLQRKELTIQADAHASAPDIIDKVLSEVCGLVEVTSNLSHTAIIFSMRSMAAAVLKKGQPFLQASIEALRLTIEIWFQDIKGLKDIKVGSAKDAYKSGIVVDTVHQVMSHEWRVVVYILCTEWDGKTSSEPHPGNYIASSRCTSYLIIVNLLIGNKASWAGTTLNRVTDG